MAWNDVQTGLDNITNTEWNAMVASIQSHTNSTTVVVGLSGNVDYLCDGVADDVQIQAAIDYVNGLGGGSVYSNQGDYSISDTILMKSNVSLILNHRAKLILDDGVNKNVITATSVDKCFISGGEIDGNKANQSSTSFGIRYVTTTNSGINNIVIHDCFIHGASFETSNSLTIENLKSYSNGFDGLFGKTSNRVILQNLELYSNGRHGLNVGAGGVEAVTDFVFDAIIAYSNTSTGIHIDDVNVGLDGYVTDPMAGILSNSIAYSNGTSGIGLDGVIGVLCTSNISRNNGSNGINVTSSKYCIVDNCVVYDNSQTTPDNWDGIKLVSTYGTSTYNKISNCIIYDSQGSKTQQYAINETGTCDNNTFENNVVINNSVGSIATVGDNTISINNRGYNPAGNITPPSVPASTVNYTNINGYPCQVQVLGGTVTDIDIDDVATGLTTGIFFIPVGETINITYSSVPTWVWWGL
ncbi:MAG: right-handed parallel beta-helix repeat-containing protein [Gammaproteobacteria bacterium]|nr:right-handed parallel beta-helix repeat-containing protein [Gammaproteobacteria bacterium]